VTVTGSGSVRVRPDLARVGISVQAAGAEAITALDRATETMTEVFAALAGQGIGEDDFATDGLTVQQAWANGQPSGYECSQQLQLLLGELDAVGTVLRAVAAVGGDRLRINDLRLDIRDRSEGTEQARALAFADARARAEQYARLAGRQLGAVVSVSEQVGSAQPVRMARLAMAAAAAPAVPISAGGLDVQMSVTVQWALLA